PGLNVSCGPLRVLTTAVEFVDVPPGRSTNDSPRSVRNRNPWRMLPPGAPPSWSPSAGSICRYWYVGPPAALIASISVFQVTLASTTALPVPPATPSLSWISSTATRSGALRLVISVSASPANFDGGSLGARFSTLNDAISSSLDFGVSVTSRWRLPVAVTSSSG